VAWYEDMEGINLILFIESHCLHGTGIHLRSITDLERRKEIIPKVGLAVLHNLNL
jgi:hypothetical protein